MTSTSQFVPDSGSAAPSHVVTSMKPATAPKIPQDAALAKPLDIVLPKPRDTPRTKVIAFSTLWFGLGSINHFGLAATQVRRPLPIEIAVPNFDRPEA